jgi:hypothetical protein
MTKKLKIIADGTISGTRVVTPGGEELWPQNVRFSHNANEPPMMILEFVGFTFEAAASADRRGDNYSMSHDRLQK